MKNSSLPFQRRSLFGLLLFPALGFSQTTNFKIPIPVKNRLVYYADTCRFSKSQSHASSVNKAITWVSSTFKGEGSGLVSADKASGFIKGKGMFKIITSDSGNYYWLKFNINITVTDSGSILSFVNYYEKPIESGISNEYSRIEYRWGDYRRSKPWSDEDEKLFLGLHANSLVLLESFKKEMNK
jgi:hypothetical protein